MYMVEKLDAGDILTQVRVPIEDKDTVGSMHDKLSEAGSKLLIETIPNLLKGKITPIKQEETKVSYAWNITRDDEKINWNKSAREVYNQIRGLNPWPVAFTTFHGEVFKIWFSEVIDETAVDGNNSPGSIVNMHPTGLDVACGNGVLRLLEVQPTGKRRMSGEDYIRGLGGQISPGLQFE